MTPEKIKAKYVTPIDPIELAIRMLEAAMQVRRPQDVSAATAFFGMDKQDQDAWLRAANAAMNYWGECINDMQRPS